ncbi:MAG TPA: alanine:cation symporter family protein, partial [Vicinamibacterales bacterium]|nr:alanine:cation symporter family protein [Vicinamibacterales bacterium]
AILPYRLVWVVAVYVGSVVSLGLVWDFSDLANGLMALPNLIALVLLSNVIAAETRRYLTSGSLDSAGD